MSENVPHSSATKEENLINDESSKDKTTKSNEIELDILVNKLENLAAVEPSSPKLPKENKSPLISSSDNPDDSKTINYFSKTFVSKKVASPSTKTVIDEKKLQEVKLKILANMEKNKKYSKAIEIPLDKSYLLFKEYERKIQDYQIQQLSEKLLQGQNTVKYDYSLFNEEEKLKLVFNFDFNTQNLI